MGGSAKSNYGNIAGRQPSPGNATVPSWTPDTNQPIPVGYSTAAANQTYGAESKPAWMTGVWDMPWGVNASTGETMSNADLAPKNYQPPVQEESPAPAAPQRQAGGFDMRGMYDVFAKQQDWESRRNDMRMQEGLGGSNGAMMGLFNPAFSPLAKAERQQRRMGGYSQNAADWAAKAQSASGQLK